MTISTFRNIFYPILYSIVLLNIQCSKQAIVTSQKFTNLKAYEGVYASTLASTLNKDYLEEITINIIDENTIGLDFKGGHIFYNPTDGSYSNFDFKANATVTEYPIVGSTSFAANIPLTNLTVNNTKSGNSAFSISGTLILSGGSLILVNPTNVIEKPTYFTSAGYAKK